LSALQALQEKVQAQAKVGPWLEQKGLNKKQRLWQDLQVEKGWETALEAVLRERVTALQAGDLNDAVRLAQDAPPSRLAFYSGNGVSNSDSSVNGLTSLMSRVQVKDSGIKAVMQEWLGNVFIADSLEDAMRRREQLPQGGVLLVKEGHIVSRVSLQLYAEDSEQAGLLARGQEIENLDLQLKAQQLILDEAQSEANRAQSAYHQAHQLAQQARQTAEQAVREAHNLEVERLQLAQADEKYRSRAEQINRELDELTQQSAELQSTRDEGQGELDRVQNEKGLHGDSLTTAQDAYQAAQHALEQAREALRLSEREASEASFNTRTLSQRISDLTRDQQSAQQQVGDIQVSLGNSQEELRGLSDEAAEIGEKSATEMSDTPSVDLGLVGLSATTGDVETRTCTPSIDDPGLRWTPGKGGAGPYISRIASSGCCCRLDGVLDGDSNCASKSRRKDECADEDGQLFPRTSHAS
jgi:chromosome segregation protein